VQWDFRTADATHFTTITPIMLYFLPYELVDNIKTTVKNMFINVEHCFIS